MIQFKPETFEEIWLCCGNDYEASSLGQIRSNRPINQTGKKKPEPLIIKGNVTRCGYRQILIYDGQSRKQTLVHRLVAKAFIENPLNLPQVNHKDGNKLNNCVKNLEWCNASTNGLHSYRHGLSTKPKGELHGGCKLKENDIITIRDLFYKGTKQKKIAEDYGICQQSVSNIVNRKSWSHI